MRLGEIISFRKDLYFEGAVQADWFYDHDKAAKVAENFVFHGKDYFGVEAKKDSIDTISLVRSLANKFGRESENPRSLAIADYGTGKSHLAVTLAVLFSGPQFMPDTYKKVLNNIKAIDSEAAAQIGRLTKDRNFVIVLNGVRDFNLHSEILRATQRSLSLYGIDDGELKKINRTIDTANRFFELNSISHLKEFENAAEKRGWYEKGEMLRSRIAAEIGANDDAFEIINDVYELITGQRIRWEEGISAKSILEMLLSRYCGLNGSFDNVIILFDEFGRFLEYASGTDGGKCGDNALQEIFEVSQNAAGALQIINFIQTDIKTYLLRVDQSRNLSRYIGRYDESEKYHISSNLETVFANLISRTDKKAFNEKIVSWQDKHDEEWKNLFQNINNWSQTSGIWADYAKFRKVIVEGIYPMHPISVFMLTQLSDYLQNRSSMNLISQYIADVSDINVDEAIPIVLPTELMKGDLFVEMLAAETSGRHRSDYCIRYENVLKKNEHKFEDKHVDVLRANLITRTLRLNTRSYDEAKESLRICSGLSSEEIDEALSILVDEYAVMAFDEMSGCFDFTEDAKGAYDYKILKARLLSRQKTDIRSMLSTASILDIGGFTSNQPTNFSTIHKILTNEWCFTQEVMLAEDLNRDIAKRYVDLWKQARSVVSPKGRLIWVYVNKDTDYHVIENLQNVAHEFVGTPIVMMLLNDTDNMLKNVLSEYDAIDHMDEDTRKAYNAIFVKDRDKVQENMKNVFDSLKKNRLQITPHGTERWSKRVPVALTEIFENLYPEVVSYNFDGLLTSGNNFTGNGVKYYCQILRMLLSNKVNFDTIHDFPRDIRNRIEALFMIDNASAWKCLTKECAIVPPLNGKARAIFDLVEAQLKETESFECVTFFDTFCAPPYGLSEESAAMFLAMIIVNLWHNVRVQYEGVRTTVGEWKDNVVEDKKLHLNVFKETRILWVDTGSVESKFQLIFKKISDNRDLDDARKLRDELKNMVDFYGLPESLDAHYRLAQIRLSEFEKAENIWINSIGDVTEDLESALETGNTYKALSTIENIKTISIASIFNRNGIDVSEKYNDQLKTLLMQADSIIKESFDEWISRSLYCRNVSQMKAFESFYTKCRDLLSQYGYRDFARRVDAQGERELNNKKEIKSRQELIEDGKKFLSDANRISQTNLVEIRELTKRADDLEPRFIKYNNAIGKEAIDLYKRFQECSTNLRNRKEKMENDMFSIFDIVADAETVESMEMAMDCLGTVLSYTIPDKDRTEFRSLQKLLNELQADCNEIMSKSSDRKAFQHIKEDMLQKYNSEEIDYDFLPIINDSLELTSKKLDENDEKWRTDNITLGDKSRQAVHDWKRRIEELPAFLSERTLKEIKEMDAEADQLISEGKIEDVVLYFDRLDRKEKEKCLELLNANYLNRDNNEF